MPKTIDNAPERPLCGCGARAATHMVEITVRRLELARDAGAHTRRYWSTTYHGAQTRIEAPVCDECLRAKINVAIAVNATVENAKEKENGG